MVQREVQFSLYVRSDKELQDAVVIMTSAANLFFSAAPGGMEHSVVLSYDVQAFPACISKRAHEFCAKLRRSSCSK